MEFRPTDGQTPSFRPNLCYNDLPDGQATPFRPSFRYGDLPDAGQSLPSSNCFGETTIGLTHSFRVGIPANRFGPVHISTNEMQMREAIMRELEKERIREEIIAAEVVRRRALEAEVRRELRMEREMAMRRAGIGGLGADGFPLLPPHQHLHHRVESRPALTGYGSVIGRSLEDRIAFSLEDRLGQSSRMGSDTVPFQLNPEAKILEIESESLPESGQDKSTTLEKAIKNISANKRKAVTSELVEVDSRKKAKEEWSCAVCQISATSELGLQDHLRGKRHRAKEAALRGQRAGPNVGLGVTPKRTTAKIINLPETTSKPTTKSRKNNPEPALPMKKPDKNESKKREENKRKFQFWCELCQIGAYSDKVLNNHKRGKKHRQNLLKSINIGSAVVATAENARTEKSESVKEDESIEDDEAEPGKDSNIESDS